MKIIPLGTTIQQQNFTHKHGKTLNEIEKYICTNLGLDPQITRRDFVKTVEKMQMPPKDKPVKQVTLGASDYLDEYKDWGLFTV